VVCLERSSSPFRVAAPQHAAPCWRGGQEERPVGSLPIPEESMPMFPSVRPKFPLVALFICTSSLPLSEQTPPHARTSAAVRPSSPILSFFSKLCLCQPPGTYVTVKFGRNKLGQHSASESRPNLKFKKKYPRSVLPTVQLNPIWY
jgi:hypothetical protein